MPIETEPIPAHVCNKHAARKLFNGIQLAAFLGVLLTLFAVPVLLFTLLGPIACALGCIAILLCLNRVKRPGFGPLWLEITEMQIFVYYVMWIIVSVVRTFL
jgi:hypothetical protein